MDKKSKEKFPGFPPKPSNNFWRYPRVMDNYWHQLSGSEQKILDYMLRRTWGFNKEFDEISLTQLEFGIKNLDKGTGLSRPTIIKAIKSLIKENFIMKSSGKKANNYKLVNNPNYSDKSSLPLVGKTSLPTIDINTINRETIRSFSSKEKADAYKKGKRWGESPYFWNQEVRWSKGKWQVIPEGGGSWLEFAGQESEIEWK